MRTGALVTAAYSNGQKGYVFFNQETRAFELCQYSVRLRANYSCRNWKQAP